MDLLAKRYASPFVLLDEMIRQGRFFDFVCEINKIRTEERMWEVWLHKVFDKPFNEWRDSIMHTNQVNLEATVKNSYEMLNNFKLDGGE